jgi:phage portal protein BeeE
LLFADWLVLGRALIAQGWRRTLDAYEAQLVVDHSAPPLEAAGSLLFKLAELERAEQQAFWRQGATVFAVVSGASGLVATPAQAEVAREALQRSVRAAGVGGIEVLPTALEFKELSRTLKDYGFEGLKIMLIRELCNLFSIDSSLLNDPENKTYSNKELAEQALFVNVVIPQVYHFLYELTLALRAAGELQLQIEADASNIEALAEQRRQHAMFVVELFKAGLLTPEEAKAKLEI